MKSKSKRAKETITSNTFSATLPSGQPVDAVLDITAIRAVELAESDARERAVRAHLKAKSGSKKFLDYYDNDNE